MSVLSSLLSTLLPLVSRQLPGKLSRRLLFWLLMISGINALIATSIQIYLDYRRDLNDLNSKLNFVQQHLLPSISEAAWNYDHNQLTLLVKGIAGSPWIKGVSVRYGTDNSNTHQFGQLAEQHPDTVNFPLQKKEGLRRLSVGNLYIQPNFSEVYQRSWDRLSVVITTQFFKMLIVSLSLIWLVHLLITRHLARLTQYACSFQPDAPFQPITLQHRSQQKTELDDLATSLNAAYQRLSEHYAALKQQQDQLQAEIISSTQDLEWAHRRLALSLKAGQLATWDWRIDTHENLVDDAWLEMLGYQRGDLPENYESLLSLVHPDDVPRLKKEVDDHLAGRTAFYSADFRLRAKEGHWRWIHSGGLGVDRDASGRITRMVGIHQDITARLEAEQAKKNFVSSVNHEIRTPMSAIIGFCTLALNTELTAKQQDYLQKINHSAQFLLHIINDVLDYAKIEANKLEIEQGPFQLAEVLANVANIAAVSTHDKGINLSFSTAEEIPNILIGDGLRLEQILINLTSNAVKFTERGEIRVTTQCMPLTDNKVELYCSVKDTGIGIANENLADLFKPFAQADSSISRRFGGTGLGLAICHKLVNLMDGQIWVESTLGHGSNFQFSLVLAKPAATDPADASTSTGAKLPPTLSTQFQPAKIPAALAGKRILLAEDNAFNRQVASEMLTQANMTVDYAVNGHEVMEKVLAHPFSHGYDAILMDIQMPKMDGLSAARSLRTHPQLAYLPIIALTAHDMRTDRLKSLAAGMNDHLNKPIIPATLYAMLIRWITPGPSELSEVSSETLQTNTPEVQHDWPELAGLDRSACQQLCNGNLSRLPRLLRFFLADMEQAKEALYTALQQNDLAAMGRQAHVIKGAAANLGALTLYRHAQRLERDLAHTPTRSDSLNKVIHVIHSDLHNLQQTIELLTRNLPETTVKAPSILSADELATSLQRLTEQIDEHLLVSAEQLAQLSASLGEPALKISMEKIESALNQFDFDCAAAALATLKQQLKQQLNASHSNQDFQTTCSLGA